MGTSLSPSGSSGKCSSSSTCRDSLTVLVNCPSFFLIVPICCFLPLLKIFCTFAAVSSFVISAQNFFQSLPFSFCISLACLFLNCLYSSHLSSVFSLLTLLLNFSSSFLDFSNVFPHHLGFSFPFFSDSLQLSSNASIMSFLRSSASLSNLSLSISSLSILCLPFLLLCNACL